MLNVYLHSFLKLLTGSFGRKSVFTLNTKNFLCLKWGRKFAGPATGSCRAAWPSVSVRSSSSCGRSAGAGGSGGTGGSGSAGEEPSGCGCSSFAFSFCGSAILEFHDTFSTTTATQIKIQNEARVPPDAQFKHVKAAKTLLSPIIGEFTTRPSLTLI